MFQKYFSIGVIFNFLFYLMPIKLVMGEIDNNISNTLARRKRYLLFPDGGPARVQFILGLGVPVELEEQAVTSGLVLKFLYDVPLNSTEYTTRITDAAQLVSRGGGHPLIIQYGNKLIEDVNNIDYLPNNLKTSDNFSNSSEEVSQSEIDDILVDINFSNETSILEKLNDKVLGNRISRSSGNTSPGGFDNEDDDLDDNLNERSTNRWHLYQMIEKFTERFGFGGRACLLRMVCESADVPFTHHNGLLGEIVHILFTPSTSRDTLTEHADNEYHAAERLGHAGASACQRLFAECEDSPLDMFTRIHSQFSL